MFVVTIDGSAGSGKGTLGARLAKHFGFLFIDSGLLYRAVASIVLERGGDPIEAASALAPADFERPDLRSEKVSNATPIVAKIPEVRKAINYSIKRMVAEAEKGAVIDGRDIGTVVFPEAQVKFFLKASPETRAGRRCLQLREKGENPDYEEVLSDITTRDKWDRERNISPMVPAEDAIVLPTDDLDADAVFEVVSAICGHMLHGVRA